MHHIRCAQAKLNEEMKTVPTAGGQGYEYHNLEEYIQWILRTDPPTNPDDPIMMKFCFDGATLTSTKQIQQEVAAFNLLYSDMSDAQVFHIFEFKFVFTNI